MSRPTAFLLHGFLGTGKTTLARRLEAEEAAVCFTHDDWMSALYGRDPPDISADTYGVLKARFEPLEPDEERAGVPKPDARHSR